VNRGQIHRMAGKATISEVAWHWKVGRDTAMLILKDRGVPFVDGDGSLQVVWEDVRS
jgi:hypothetical protein